MPRPRVSFGAPLVLLALSLATSQVIWNMQGADEASTDAPPWVTVARGGAFLFLVCVLVTGFARTGEGAVRKKVLPATLISLAASVAIASFVQGSGFPKPMSYLGYIAAALAWIVPQKFPEGALRGSMMALRVLCYGSIALALLFPSAAFSGSPRRFSVLGLEYRLSGVVGNPNILGFLCIILSLLALAHAEVRWRLDLPVAVGAIILTESRTAMITLALCCALWLLRGRRGPLRLIFVGTLIAGLGVMLRGLFLDVNYNIARGEDLLNSRPLIWEWSVNRWLSQPFWGAGGDVFIRDISLPVNVYWVHAHNQVLQDLVTGGVIRALAAATFLVALTVLAYGSATTGDWLPSAIVLTLATQAITEVPLYFATVDFRFAGLIFLLIGLSAHVASSTIYRRVPLTRGTLGLS